MVPKFNSVKFGKRILTYEGVFSWYNLENIFFKFSKSEKEFKGHVLRWNSRPLSVSDLCFM